MVFTDPTSRPSSDPTSRPSLDTTKVDSESPFSDAHAQPAPAQNNLEESKHRDSEHRRAASDRHAWENFYVRKQFLFSQ